MTDRIKGLTVFFEDDMRADDAEALIQAISQLRNVAKVEPSIVTNDDIFARQNAIYKLRQQLRDILWPELGPQ